MNEEHREELHVAQNPVASDSLRPEHHEQLHQSGLTDETIQRVGFHSCDDTEGRRLLGWSAGVRGSAAGLVIPFFEANGDPADYALVRLDHPREGHGKYECPMRREPSVWFPPRTLCPDLANPEKRLIITEGAKKAAAACQEGLCCVGLPGVSMAHDRNLRRQSWDDGADDLVLLSELRDLAIENREVVVAFDSDLHTNKNVLQSAVRTALMVRQANGHPAVLYVPGVKGLAKTGLDDYLYAQRTRWQQWCRTGPDRAAQAEPRHLEPGQRVAWLDGLGLTPPLEEAPALPDELLEWLGHEHDSIGWDRNDSRRVVQRAARWVEAWYAEVNPQTSRTRAKKWVDRALRACNLRRQDIEAEEEPPADRSPYRSAGKPEWHAQHVVPLLNERYRLLRDDGGLARVYSINDKQEVVLQQGEEGLRVTLHDELTARLGAPPPSCVLSTGLEFWRRAGSVLPDEPEPFCFAGDNRPCFKRFDWQPTEGPFPAWEEFLSRLSDRDAFMAFVWSCFEKRNKGRQYVWLRGEGQDGKSKVLGVIQDVFGCAAAAINNTHVKNGNQFFFSGLYGRRIVVYPDCKNPKFGMMEIVRNCTSGDPVPVEFKGETPFTVRMRVKLFVASNPKPEFTSQTADKSRIIYIEVTESEEKDDPQWEERLKAELPGFLWACRLVYERVCPHHGDIRVSEKTNRLLDEAATSFEEEFHLIFDASFREAPGEVTPAKDVVARVRDRLKTNDRIADFKAWMERVHHVHYRPTKSARLYEGLALVERPWG